MFDFLPLLKAVILRFCSPDFLSPVFCRLTPGVSQEDMTQFYDMTWFYDMTLVLVVEAHLGPGHSPTLSLTYYIPWLGPFQKCQSPRGSPISVVSRISTTFFNVFYPGQQNYYPVDRQVGATIY